MRTLVHVSNLYYVEHRDELAERLVGLARRRARRCSSATRAPRRSRARSSSRAGGARRGAATACYDDRHRRAQLPRPHARDARGDRSAVASRRRSQPLPPGFTHVPLNDLEALEAAVDRRHVRGPARARPGRGRRVPVHARVPGRRARSCATSVTCCSSSTRCRRASSAPVRRSPGRATACARRDDAREVAGERAADRRRRGARRGRGRRSRRATTARPSAAGPSCAPRRSRRIDALEARTSARTRRGSARYLRDGLNELAARHRRDRRGAGSRAHGRRRSWPSRVRGRRRRRGARRRARAQCDRRRISCASCRRSCAEQTEVDTLLVPYAILYEARC